MSFWCLQIDNKSNEIFVRISALASKNCSTPGIWGFRKVAKPDFCLSEFSYYSKHLWIWKAIYGTEKRSNKKSL